MTQDLLTPDELEDTTVYRSLFPTLARRSGAFDQGQEATTLLMLAHLEHHLSGRGSDRILGDPSHRRFFLSTLAPKEMEEDEDGDQTPASDYRDQSSIGARFLIHTDEIGSAELDITLDASIFYPVFPTWEDVDRIVRRRPDQDEEPEVDAETGGTRKVGAKEYDLPSAEKRLPISETWQISLDDVMARSSQDVEIGIESLEEAEEKAKADPDVLRMEPDPDGGTRPRNRVPDIEPDLLESGDAEQEYQEMIEGINGPPAVAPYRGQVYISIVEFSNDLLEVSVVFENRTQPGSLTELTKGNLFDVRFEINVQGAQIRPIELEQLRRKDPRLDSGVNARGMRCVVGEEDGRIRNHPIPWGIVPIREQTSYAEEHTRFSVLDGDDALQALEKFAEAMEQYGDEWSDRIGGDEDDSHQADYIDQYRDEVKRFRGGIEALRLDQRAERAFKIANRTINRAKDFDSWRPFQLAFFVSTVKDVVAREQDLQSDDRDKVDVLWFPTGGGKTEVYLALILFALSYDRLRGKDRGVSAWIKFPLRMLSLDQLDRFAEVLMTLNEIKEEEGLPGDDFEIGYFMGARNTPNHWSVPQQYNRYGITPEGLSKKFTNVRENKPELEDSTISASVFEDLAPRDARRYQLIDVCPHPSCSQATYIWPDETARTISIQCPVHGRLPVRFIDDEIYRNVPGVVISTIDKLTIIAFNERMRNLLVRPYHECSKHGYLPTQSCRHCRSLPQGERGSITKVQPEEFYDPAPALQVQDELHLLKEQLGSYNSHYEALVGYLHSDLLTEPDFNIDGHGGGTKILAATATITAYERQVAHLYGKDSRRFPALGPEPGTTFYAEDRYVDGRPVPQRIMAGIWPTLTKLPGALKTIQRTFLETLANLAEDPKRYRSLLASLGAPTEELSSDDLQELLDLLSTEITYYLNKQHAYLGTENLHSELEEYVERWPESPLGDILPELDAETLTGDSEFREIRETKSRLERGGFPNGDWLAHVSATSIISHGVDVSRLNFLLFSGMPADTSEYIQASSRVGRRGLGLSLVAYNISREREEGHYINHSVYHDHLNLHVEGVAINRGSRYLLQRTFPGLVAAMIRLYWNPTHRAPQRYEFSMGDARPLLEALQDPNVIKDFRPKMEDFLARSTAIPDPGHLQEQLESEWSAMEQEGRRYEGQAQSMKGMFPEHKPLLNHRNIEPSFPLSLDVNSQGFLDQTGWSQPGQEPEGSTVENAPDDGSPADEEPELPDDSEELGGA